MAAAAACPWQPVPGRCLVSGARQGAQAAPSASLAPRSFPLLVQIQSFNLPVLRALSPPGGHGTGRSGALGIPRNCWLPLRIAQYPHLPALGLHARLHAQQVARYGGAGTHAVAQVSYRQWEAVGVIYDSSIGSSSLRELHFAGC